MSKTEKATREYLETLSKEQVINLCLQFMFDVEVTEQQLAVKGQEINIKNNKLAELKKELTICKDKLRRKTQSNRDLQHRVHNVNTQLAIQELEKVKDYICDYSEITGQVWNHTLRFLNNRIKELKGE